MSRALKCDRCGRFFERQLLGEDQVICATVTRERFGPVRVHRPDFREVVVLEREINAELIDLCPECLHSFGDWFNGHYNQEEIQDE